MLDIKFIRDNLEQVKRGLEAKRVQFDAQEFLRLDQERRDILVKIEDLRREQNRANDEISALIREKKDPKIRIASMKQLAEEIDRLEPRLKESKTGMDQFLLRIPNIPHVSVQPGGAEASRQIRTWGEKRAYIFTPKTHMEIAERLDIIDFKRAAKITGSNFILFKKAGAQLQRALFNFMLDVHTNSHGYVEVFPPFLVNRDSMTGTGQLPKMEEDMYKLSAEDFFLIPTAEVAVTNIHRDEVLNEEDLPVKYTAYSACFRREAGSYGKETKGLIRVHQFDKVELVKFVKPESSYEELELLVKDAETILKLLELPYRVIQLASGDLSFAAAKCYDLEAHAPGMDHWLEVSSCSNFEDFQARRANIRYKSKSEKKSAYVHTLNGSGVALARTVVAILENYQTAEGDVVIPQVLHPYMGGREKITR